MCDGFWRNGGGTVRLPYKSGTVRVTSPYGRRNIDGIPETHKGIDLVGSDKTIVAPCGGRVGWAGLYDDSTSGGRTWEWGNYIRIDTDTGYSVYLCHLADYSVRIGQTVLEGQVVGTEGNTGSVYPLPASKTDKTSGRHLHFEVRKGGKSTDPTPFLEIANRKGSYPVNSAKNDANAEKSTDYASLVCEKCGLEAQTKAYLNRYKYSEDLWRKLWEAMS